MADFILVAVCFVYSLLLSLRNASVSCSHVRAEHLFFSFLYDLAYYQILLLLRCSVLISESFLLCYFLQLAFLVACSVVPLESSRSEHLSKLVLKLDGIWASLILQNTVRYARFAQIDDFSNYSVSYAAIDLVTNRERCRCILHLSHHLGASRSLATESYKSLAFRAILVLIISGSRKGSATFSSNIQILF